MSSFFAEGPSPWDTEEQGPRPPVKLSRRNVRAALEGALMPFSRKVLESLLPEELDLAWGRSDVEPQDSDLTKRDLFDGYTHGWSLP